MNSASRISALVSNLHLHSSENHLINIWAKALNIEEENQNKKAVMVIEGLSLAHKELIIFNSQLQKSVFTPSVYEPVIQRLELAFSPLLLNSTWGSAHGHLGGDTLTALQIFSQALPNEEANIEPEELRSILEAVAELESMLCVSGLPDRLISLICHHIDMIRTAINEYQIAGAAALRNAFHTAVGEIVESRDVIKEHSSNSAVTKLKEVWEQVDKTTDRAIKAADLLELGSNIVNYLKDFF